MIAAFDKHLGTFTIALFGVVMTLLVIVFVSVPFCTYDGPFVSLPWAKTATILIGSERDLTLRLAPRDRIVVGHAVVPSAQLPSVLREVFLRTPDRRIVVEADGTLKFDSVQHALAAARDAGFRDIYLVTFRGTALQALSRQKSP